MANDGERLCLIRGCSWTVANGSEPQRMFDRCSIAVIGHGEGVAVLDQMRPESFIGGRSLRALPEATRRTHPLSMAHSWRIPNRSQASVDVHARLLNCPGRSSPFAAVPLGLIFKQGSWVRVPSSPTLTTWNLRPSSPL
jgi:hypothetical protein